MTFSTLDLFDRMVTYSPRNSGIPGFNPLHPASYLAHPNTNSSQMYFPVATAYERNTSQKSIRLKAAKRIIPRKGSSPHPCYLLLNLKTKTVYTLPKRQKIWFMGIPKFLVWLFLLAFNDVNTYLTKNLIFNLDYIYAECNYLFWRIIGHILVCCMKKILRLVYKVFNLINELNRIIVE